MTDGRWEQAIAGLAERIARCEQYDKSVNGNIREIKEALRRMEDKLDARLERMSDSDVRRGSQYDERISELDRHVRALIVKIGVVWTLVNGGLLAIAGYVITATITGGQ